MIKVCVARLLGGSGGMPPPPEKLLKLFLVYSGVKLQKLDVLLLNLVVVFEASRIKGVTLFWAAEAAKQQVTGLAEAVRAAWFWLDHFFTQAKKKVPCRL